MNGSPNGHAHPASSTGEAIPIPRVQGETDKAYLALCDYCAQGPTRSLRALSDSYKSGRKRGGSGAAAGDLSTLEAWSSLYGWQARANTYDVALREKARAEIEEEAVTGLALPGERVRLLKRIAARLTDEEGGEESALSVTLRTPPMIAQLRGVLDDLAKETGGRVTKQEVKTPEGYGPEDNIYTRINQHIVGGDPLEELRRHLIPNGAQP